MAFYDDMNTVADSLITDKGASLTFGRETSSAFDPVLGVNTTASSTYTGYAVATQYKRPEIDGTIIQVGDIKLILQGTATVPILGDTVTIDSLIYRVMNIESVMAANCCA